MTIKTVRVGDLSLHSGVPDTLRSVWASMCYVVEGSSALSPEALKLLLSLHPPVVCCDNTNGQQYSCCAGLRSWQLAKSYLSPSCKIKVVYFENVEDISVSQIALIDFYLSTVILGIERQRLGKRDANLKVWASVMTKTLLAKLGLMSESVSSSFVSLPKVRAYKIARRAIADIQYDFRIMKDDVLPMSLLAIEVFTLCHPPQLAIVKDGEEDSYYCFANKHTVFSHKQAVDAQLQIKTCLHSNLDENMVKQLDVLDQALSPIFFGLSHKMWKHDLLRIWDLVGRQFKHKDLLVGLRSKSSLAQAFSLNRNTLYSVKQHPQSALQKLRKNND